MLFHTWPFFIFFLIFYPIYIAIKHTKWCLPWLLLASYVFYAWWNPLYLILIVYSTLLDYIAVNGMAKSQKKKLWLWISIVNNLWLLGFFKYGGFITDNINGVLSAIGLAYQIPAPDVLLPVGISFYTFQSMSYTIDFYRGQIQREPSFIRFAAFVSLFPQLVAGPIERAKNLLPQLYGVPRITRLDITDGMSLFVLGLFKKVALANYLALYADRVYAVPDQYQSPALILATLAFGWQIYFDFSGYTDMARGIARMMGFKLMLNFNNPYLATGLGDFWSRWHISLSTWFKDYVYIPLGGNRKGTFFTYRNVSITMVVSGLWHGAAWTFIIWGALHAIGTMITRELERNLWYKNSMPRWAKQLWVYIFTNFTWIFFRAENVSEAWLIICRIFTSGLADPLFPIAALVLTLSVTVYQYLYESNWKRIVEYSPVRISLVILMIIYLSIFPGTGEQAFIYFQF
ncbi:MAG: MBOAT family protein [Candidatus Omnitrophota bacterium]|jgi:D-alanyl-lipoteichoic acid acyltransferase DltB (MBOAT superfamily)|nr:MAG: MBOAT family protein [Candidatus Omnitrophota bacterium]